MAPLWKEVVAPNDDTLYGSTYVDVSQQPLILTIPSSKATWSLLSTDAYGDVFETGISAAGTYGLTAPGWNGTLPSGITQVNMPTTFSQMIIRSDKYSAGVSKEAAASASSASSLRAPNCSGGVRNQSAGARDEAHPAGRLQLPVQDDGRQYDRDRPNEAFLGQLQRAPCVVEHAAA